MERAQRRVLIQYPKRQTARGQMQAERSHLPLKINTAGVIPPIFASSLLLMPLTIAQFAGNRVDRPTAHWSDLLITHHHRICSTARRSTWCSTRAGIIFFCFFYTAVVFNPRGDGGESEAEWRLHPRHPPGQAHRGISRLRADPHHRDRRGLSDADLPGARNT